MINNTKKKILLQICAFAFILIAIIGVVVWRNIYGRRERVRVLLINGIPNLSKSEIWDIDQYSENKTTKWRVRKFKSSGVIKSHQPLFSLNGMYEPHQDDPISITIYNFETLKEMTSGIPFEIYFDNKSNSAQNIKTSFKIPKFYTTQDLNELCTKGVVVIDGEIMDGSFQQPENTEKFITQLDLQQKKLEKELSLLENIFCDDFSSLSRKEKKNQITQAKRDIYGRLALLTVISRICRSNVVLKDYSAKSLQYSAKYHSILSHINELEKSIPTRGNSKKETSLYLDGIAKSQINSSSLSVSQNLQEPEQATQPPLATRTTPHGEKITSVHPVIEPEKLLPTMMPKVDTRTESWAKLHRPDLYNRYVSSLTECEKRQSFELMSDAILKYNAVCKQLIAEKQSYDANPVKNEDLSPEILEFAKTKYPEYYRKYLKSRKNIRNRRILYNKARNDGASQNRLDQLQAEINSAIVSFNAARQHIMNLHTKKE